MRHESSASFEPSEQAPALARGMITSFLAGQHLEDLIPSAALLLSELVTNSVMHARGPVLVDTRWSGDVLHVDVCDGGTGPVCPRQPDEGGLGLVLVDALASDWGSSRWQESGRLTWFELSRAD